MRSYLTFLPQQGAEREAEVVRPQHNGQNALAKGEMKKADGEKPAEDPYPAHETMLLNFYLLHMFKRIPLAELRQK